jgi:hypothetical protein
LFEAFSEAVAQGMLATFLPMLTEDTVTECLKQNGYSDDQVYYANLALRGFTMMYMGTLASSTVGVAANALLLALGFSEKSSATAATVTALATTAVMTSASITTTAAVLAGGIIGSQVGSSLLRVGFWAQKKMFAQVEPDLDLPRPEKAIGHSV